MSDITIVTAFFDLGRGSLPTEVRGRVLPHHQHRTTDTYFEFFRKQAKIQNDMVVYTTEDCAEKIHNIRKEFGLENRTKIVVMPSYLPDELKEYKGLIEKIQASPEYYGKVTNPQLIEYWHADYVLVNIFKAFYVTHAINSGLVKTDLTAWIDFGYCRSDANIPNSKVWDYDFDESKIHLFNYKPYDNKPIDHAVLNNDVYILGAKVVAHKNLWQKMSDLMTQSFIDLQEKGLVDDDQGLWLQSYINEPEVFELHQIPDHQYGHDPFVLFNKFNNKI